MAGRGGGGIFARSDHAEAARDESTDGLACLWVTSQRGIFHRLLKLKLDGAFPALSWDGLIDVGGHSSILGLEKGEPRKKYFGVQII